MSTAKISFLLFLLIAVLSAVPALAEEEYTCTVRIGSLVGGDPKLAVTLWLEDGKPVMSYYTVYQGVGALHRVPISSEDYKEFWKDLNDWDFRNLVGQYTLPGALSRSPLTTDLAASIEIKTPGEVVYGVLQQDSNETVRDFLSWLVKRSGIGRTLQAAYQDSDLVPSDWSRFLVEVGR